MIVITKMILLALFTTSIFGCVYELENLDQKLKRQDKPINNDKAKYLALIFGICVSGLLTLYFLISMFKTLFVGGW